MIRDSKDAKLNTDKEGYNTVGAGQGDIVKLTHDVEEVKRMVMDMKSLKAVKFS